MYVENFSMSPNFKPKKEELFKLLDRYEPFKKALAKIPKNYRSRINSAKYRFAIAFTLHKIKTEIANEKAKNNVKVS